MPYLLEDLVINRVDLVEEGANSAAFITLCKRKEKNMVVSEIIEKLIPEHAKIVKETIDNLTNDLAKSKETVSTLTTERDTAAQDLVKAKETLETVTSELETLKKAKEGPTKEEELIKSLPEDVRKFVNTLRVQKEAAEEAIRKAKEAEENSVAVAKATELKAIPVEKEKLVTILKGASPELVDVLTTISAALSDTVLGEVGKNNQTVGKSSEAAWAKIEAKAMEIAKTETLSKAKAITKAVNENPDLYKEYLEGGAN